MAENVQRRLEERIPELEQLERVGLFSSGEIKCILKKVTAHEYRLERRAISKDDFLSYVQYEMNLLELISKRRKRTGYRFKKEEIEVASIRRINKLLTRATNKWKEDVQMWLTQIDFCKQWKCRQQLGRTFTTMLAIHPSKPALWILAAKWEMEDNKSSERARRLLLRAIRFNPESTKLYQEYFRMELMHAERLRNVQKVLQLAKIETTKEDFPDNVLSGEIAQRVYQNASRTISGVKFHITLLSIAKSFDFTKELQKEIWETLKSRHPDDHRTWDVVARRQLRAQDDTAASADTSAAGPDGDAGGSGTTAWTGAVARCVAVYEEAVAALPTEAMWSCFINFCLRRMSKSSKANLLAKRKAQTLVLFDRAHQASLLSEKLYKRWAQILLGEHQEKEAGKVTQLMCERYPLSRDAWLCHLRLRVGESSADAPRLFQEATERIPDKKLLPVIILWLKWSNANRPEAETEALYQKLALSSARKVSISVKRRFLNWAYKHGGYKKAQSVFQSFQECRPHSVEFFQRMIAIEKEQAAGGHMEKLREFYERALREFGAMEPDLWLAYILEERRHPKGRPETCGKIHWRAVRTLAAEHVDLFISRFALMQAGQLQ
ncbi:U3 small nucleolar RNA-associated protein 6 homolog [Lampetra fluviatilis]